MGGPRTRRSPDAANRGTRSGGFWGRRDKRGERTWGQKERGAGQQRAGVGTAQALGHLESGGGARPGLDAGAQAAEQVSGFSGPGGGRGVVPGQGERPCEGLILACHQDTDSRASSSSTSSGAARGRASFEGQPAFQRGALCSTGSAVGAGWGTRASATHGAAAGLVLTALRFQLVGHQAATAPGNLASLAGHHGLVTNRRRTP